MISQSHKTGKLGEILAARFLREKGYNLVCKNYRIQGAELDLVMENNSLLLFVEVKTRRSHSYGPGEEALTNRKKRKIWLAINHYLRHNQIRKKWRCDLVSVHIKPDQALIKHFQNIYDEE